MGSGATVSGELSEKHRRFVEAYMGEAAGNGAEAYRMVYGRDMSDDAAANNASRLMGNDRIKAAIAERVASCPLVAGRYRLQRRLTLLAMGEQRGSDDDEWGTKPSDEIRAAELLLKTQGELVERREVTTKVDPEAARKMTPEGFAAYVASLHVETDAA